MKIYYKILQALVLSCAVFTLAVAQTNVVKQPGTLGVGLGYFYTGTSGLTIQAGTTFANDGLVLVPSSTVSINSTSLYRTTTAVTSGASTSITRVYNLTAPLTYSGTAKILYASGELNGNTESTMQLGYKAELSGGTWVVTSGSTQGSAGTYTVSNTASALTFAFLSAFTPAIQDMDGDGTADDTDPDIDGDGVLNTEEDAVPDKTGTGLGDGNGDGTADKLQAFVLSIKSAVKAKDNTDRYFTLEAPNTTYFRNGATSVPPANLGRTITARLPLGLVAFKLHGVSSPVSINLYVEKTIPLSGYYKQSNSTSTWGNVMNASVNINGNKAKGTFTLTDNNEYDDDATVGVIQDPGAIAALAFITNDGGEDTVQTNAAEMSTAVTTMTASQTGFTNYTYGEPPTPPVDFLYSIVGGADQAKFTVDATTGVLTFAAAQDYETPLDANADTVYEVVVKASSPIFGFDDYQTLLVSVTDVNDRPTVGTPTGGVALLTSFAQQSSAINAADPLINIGDDLIGTQDLDISALFNDVDVIGIGLRGIVITANSANASTEGKWQYSTDQNAEYWYDIGTVSSNSGLLLEETAFLRFVPVVNFHGRPGGLSIHVVDGSGSTVNPAPFNESTNPNPAWTVGTTKRYYTSLATDDATSSVSALGINTNIDITANCALASESELADNLDQGSIGLNGSSDVISVAGDGSNACRAIAKVVSAGGTPVEGTVTGKVWVRNTVPYYVTRPFVPRSFEITPDVNASTVTGRVTLYFTQSDFDKYNAVPNGADLPKEPTDAEGNKANLRVFKFPGISSDNSGEPGSFTQTGKVVIDPEDNDIVWNATLSRWEVTFNTIGFSGFFVANNDELLLPITLKQFSGKASASGNQLTWTTSAEVNAKEMQLERSADGISFSRIATVAAKGIAATYNYSDVKVTGVQYYRLKLVDKDGQNSYSQVLKLQSVVVSTVVLQVYPNPASNYIQLNTNWNAAVVKLYNMQGNVVLQQSWKKGERVNIARLAAGTYVVELQSSEGVVKERVVKQ